MFVKCFVVIWTRTSCFFSQSFMPVWKTGEKTYCGFWIKLLARTFTIIFVITYFYRNISILSSIICNWFAFHFRSVFVPCSTICTTGTSHFTTNEKFKFQTQLIDTMKSLEQLLVLIVYHNILNYLQFPLLVNTWQVLHKVKLLMYMIFWQYVFYEILRRDTFKRI